MDTSWKKREETSRIYKSCTEVYFKKVIYLLPIHRKGIDNLGLSFRFFFFHNDGLDRAFFPICHFNDLGVVFYTCKHD